MGSIHEYFLCARVRLSRYVSEFIPFSRFEDVRNALLVLLDSSGVRKENRANGKHGLLLEASFLLASDTPKMGSGQRRFSWRLVQAASSLNQKGRPYASLFP